MTAWSDQSRHVYTQMGPLEGNMLKFALIVLSPNTGDTGGMCPALLHKGKILLFTAGRKIC